MDNQPTMISGSINVTPISIKGLYTGSKNCTRGELLELGFHNPGVILTINQTETRGWFSEVTQFTVSGPRHAVEHVIEVFRKLSGE